MIDHRSLTITTLAENTSTRPGILGEWGLAMLVTAGERRVLLDAGSSATTVANADAMGVSLGGLDAIVLSHGHNDHTGGLAAVLARTGPVRVIAHPAALEPKYIAGRPAGAPHRFAGMPHRREALESAGARFELSAEPTWIGPDIAASGEEPMRTSFESVATSMLVERSGSLVPDPMADDQSLYFRTDLGLVVLLGCAHRGVVNVVEHARELMQTPDVYLVVGGTHLGPAGEEQLDATVEALRRIRARWLGLSHCTGAAAAARLAMELPDRYFANNAGNVIRFPLGR